MEILAVPIIVILIIGVFFILSHIHRKNIEDKINSLNGYLITYKRCSLLTGFGPFGIPGKGTHIYQVSYLINDSKKEAWVKFGGFTGTRWVLNYVE